jgi:cysteine desulfurase
MIYFDNAASMKPLPQAIAAFNTVITQNFANPAALHKGGIEAEKIITKSKQQLLSHLPKNGSLVFTSGATESNNLAIFNSTKSRRKNKIVTTLIEHPSVSGALDRLCDSYEIVRTQNITEAVDDNTALVCTTAVCGETGFIMDTPQIYDEIKARFPDCIVHVDAAQGFMKPMMNGGKVAINGDLISLSAHKVGAIPGIGGLFIKNGVRLNPMLFGGGQQSAVRPGTQPTALIAAFAQCTMYNVHCTIMFERLVAGLNRLGLKINSRNNIPNIINFSCGVKSEVMLHFLAEHSIYVSSGSACARGEKSRILPAYSVADKDIDTAIRVSFGWHNTIEEVDKFLQILEKGIKRWK